AAQLDQLSRSRWASGRYFPSPLVVLAAGALAIRPDVAQLLKPSQRTPSAQGALLNGDKWRPDLLSLNFTGHLAFWCSATSAGSGELRAVTHFYAGHSPKKSLMTTSPVYTEYSVSCANTDKSPCLVPLNSPFETQLAYFEATNCNTSCILQLDLIGHQVLMLAPVIDSSNYSESGLWSRGSETLLQMNFSRIHYVTAFTLVNLQAGGSFWVSYQLAAGEDFFPITYASETFVMPFSLTPAESDASLRRWISSRHCRCLGASCIVNAAAGTPVEKRVTWTAASQFCSEHTWGGVRGRLLDAKTAVERSFVAPPGSGSDPVTAPSLRVGAFYMGRPAPTGAALDTFTGEPWWTSPAACQLKFICQIDKYIGERQRLKLDDEF
uniref:C-type lectin domain-containing protein n=1 Tax=Macrostomum lignano TaxID=282301 RepID=A0A1I8F9X4_9PLAT